MSNQAATAQLDAIAALIATLRSNGGGSVTTLSNDARASTELLAALPPRYGEVLLNLLDRLESSALFSEESCSFSQKDLLDNLQVWADKARGQLVA
jgi:class 3 adenylate cyclase